MRRHFFLRGFWLKLYILLLVHACILTVVAQSQSPLSNKAVVESGEIDNLKLIQRVPLVHNSHDGILITIKLNDQDKVFLVDTGCTVSLVDKSLEKFAKALNMQTSMVDNYGRKTEADWYSMDFFLQDAKFSNFSFISLDLSALQKAACIHFDGVIGMNVLKKLNWKLISSERSLYFSKQPFTFVNFYSPIKLYYSNLFPLIELNINNKKLIAGIDTGASDGFSLSPQAYNLVDSNYKTLPKGFGEFHQTVSGRSSGELRRVTFKNISIGELNLNYYNAIVGTSKPIIGQEILLSGDLILNFTNDEMAFGKNTKVPVATINNQNISFCKDSQSKMITVCFLWEDNLLSKQLKIGDRVLAVDGQDATDFTDEKFCIFTTATVAKPNTVLDILRGSKRFQITLNKQ